MGAPLQGSEGSQHLGFGVGKRSLQWVLGRRGRMGLCQEGGEEGDGAGRLLGSLGKGVCRTARGAGGSDAGFVFKLFQTVSSGNVGTETEKRPAEEIQYVCVWSYTYIHIYKICTYK